jgi:hypothetical protein
MESAKETLRLLQSSPASDGLEWAHELFARARRAALRARIRAVTDRIAVRLVASALFVGGAASAVWWAIGLFAHL